MKNYGLIESTPTPTDWIVGAEMKKEVLQEDRDFSAFLPPVELQHNTFFDTYGCVTFSAWNCLEVLHKRQFGTEINKSDRFTVKMSGTIPGQGNYLNKVGDSIRHDWSVEEYKYPMTQTQAEYYADPPESIVKEAQMDGEYYRTEYRWVDWAGCEAEKLWEALQYGPLQVTVHTWGVEVDGVYQKPNTEETNHAVMIFRGEYGKKWRILDHYNRAIKDLAWDYYFGSAMQYSLNKKTMMRIIKSNTGPNVYAVDDEGVRHYVYDEKQFNYGKELGLWGDLGSVEVIFQAELEAIPEGNPIILK